MFKISIAKTVVFAIECLDQILDSHVQCLLQEQTFHCRLPALYGYGHASGTERILGREVSSEWFCTFWAWQQYKILTKHPTLSKVYIFWKL